MLCPTRRSQSRLNLLACREAGAKVLGNFGKWSMVSGLKPSSKEKDFNRREVINSNEKPKKKPIMLAVTVIICQLSFWV